MNSKVVLTVEDEFLVQDYLDEILLNAGYGVLSASNADAIKILESRDDICLIVTDIDMPGSMDGLRLAALVKDRWPPIAIVITTGKARHEIPLGANFVSKPYSSADVLRAIQPLC